MCFALNFELGLTLQQNGVTKEAGILFVMEGRDWRCTLRRQTDEYTTIAFYALE